ncbi:MAG: hypothetical protein ACT4PZ_16270 [Panacagrimonas sp.]
MLPFPSITSLLVILGSGASTLSVVLVGRTTVSGPLPAGQPPATASVLAALIALASEQVPATLMFAASAGADGANKPASASASAVGLGPEASWPAKMFRRLDSIPRFMNLSLAISDRCDAPIGSHHCRADSATRVSVTQEELEPDATLARCIGRRP